MLSFTSRIKKHLFKHILTFIFMPLKINQFIKQNKEFKHLYLAAIGFLLLLIVLINTDLKKSLFYLKQTNLLLFFFSFLLILFILFIRSFRWKILSEKQGAKLSVSQAYFYFISAFFPSLTTPGRLGEFLKVFYISDQIGMSKALSSVIADRLYDILALFLFGFLASLTALLVFSKTIIRLDYLAAMTFLLIAFFFLLIKTNLFFFFIEKAISFFLSSNEAKKYSLKIKYIVKETANLFLSLNIFLSSFFLTLISWVLSVLFVALLLKAMGLYPDLLMSFLIISFLTLAALLPITIAGIGTREALSAYIFSIFSLSFEKAIAFAILYFTSSYLFMIIFSYPFFAVLSKKIKI